MKVWYVEGRLVSDIEQREDRFHRGEKGQHYHDDAYEIVREDADEIVREGGCGKPFESRCA